MADEPNLNDRFPIGESLSPPIVASPIYECAEAAHVSGFVPHATVRVFADTNELLAEEIPPFGFATMMLHRSLMLGESITATQTVGQITSAHSITPVIVGPLPEDAVKNQKPDVGDDLYECGIVVPVGNLVPSTRVHVTENGTEIGSTPVAEPWHPVITSALHSGADVSAQAISCEGTDHEITGPWADPVMVKAAPIPTPTPAVHEPSLIVGNDTVTLTGLLVGSGIEVMDAGTTIGGNYYATGPTNSCPITTVLTSSSQIEATQQLCGNVSKPSDPVTPSGKLAAPLVLGPICDGSQFVVVRGTIVNAIVVVLRNGSPIAYGGAGQGDVMLGLGSGATLGAGDAVTAHQYMGATISPSSNVVTVVSSLSQPSIEILGGHPFFTPKGNEKPIDGPVFPRGEGGVEIRVQACCEEDVQIAIIAPDGTTLAEPALTQLFPGYYVGTWDWSSTRGWSVPQEVPVGAYAVVASTGCRQRDARAVFYVIFDPAEVNGPAGFSFASTAVWFGTGQNSIIGLHYYLHPSDLRVFSIAINAASGMTDAPQAATAIARAEENLFAYSLSYHTKDVVDLLENFTEAQCADDACCLTALLRAVGIPAHPVTADAGLETGAANWTFDTWTEFLTDEGGVIEWRIFHPHEYPDMSRETRAVFGTTRGVAVKSFNDVIVMANENWVAGQLDDWVSDVTYKRNACLEPEEQLAKAPWIGELCEDGYWVDTHWECRGVAAGVRGDDRGFRIEERDLRFGGRLAGSAHIVNSGRERRFGRLGVELVSSRVEAKAFVERSFDETAVRGTLDPGEAVAVPFVFSLPETLEPGHELYLRAKLDEQTIVLHEVRLPPQVALDIELPEEFTVDGEAIVKAAVQNLGERVLRNVGMEIRAPFALQVDGRSFVRLGDLGVGEARDVSWSLRGIAALESGSLQISVATDNGGGAIAGQHIVVLGQPVALDAQPVLPSPD